MSQYPEPTDDEIVGGEYQPYQSHAGGQVQQAHPAPVQPEAEETPESEQDSVGSHQFVLSIVSLGTGIPISAIASTNVEPGILGLAIAWAGIIGINLAHYFARRPRSPRR